MFINNIDPVLFSIGPLSVRYYGLIYVAGFLVTYFFLRYQIQTKRLKLSNEELDSYFLWLIVGVVVGARIIEVFIYSAPYYWSNPEQMIRIWDGGLSFHGGLVGAILITLWFCKRHKIHFYDLADLMVIPASIALVLGRIANFTNSELYGTITSPEKTPWCVIFQRVDGYCRHPSQIYESLYNLAMVAILYIYAQKRPKRGAMFWLFVALYGVFRFLVSFYRDEPVYSGLNMGQWLSLAMIILGTVFLYILHKPKSI